MTNPVLQALGRPFRLGLAGGAPPSAIGPVHRIGAAMDGRFALVAAVLSSRPDRSRAEGAAIGLPPERCYESVEAMIAGEAARPDGIEALSIVTPNDSHARYARLALEAGLDLMIEKPLCNDLAEARAIAALAERSGLAVALTHTYAGYPAIREMRARILAGEIGAVRLVQVEYLAGGNATLVEATPEGSARWRLKPEKSGPSLVLGDIGTHAHHLVGYVTGLRFESVSAEVGTLVPGRQVHDVAQVRFALEGGARGRLDVCNAAAGIANHLAIRVFGETGHVAWNQEDHTRITVGALDFTLRIIGSGLPGATAPGREATRLFRPGHPEGLHEAVGNLYCGLADRMLERRGHAASAFGPLTPGVVDGVEGMAFVMACLESAAADGARTALSRT